VPAAPGRGAASKLGAAAGPVAAYRYATGGLCAGYSRGANGIGSGMHPPAATRTWVRTARGAVVPLLGAPWHTASLRLSERVLCASSQVITSRQEDPKKTHHLFHSLS